MKDSGLLSEEKAINDQGATSISKLPKAQCMNDLVELEKMGVAKKRRNNPAVAFCLVTSSL